MIRCSIFLFLSFVIILKSYAQPQFEWYHHSMAGDSALYSVTGLIDFAALDTQTGADYTWDFDGLEAQVQILQHVIDKDDSGFFGSFLAACTLGGMNPFACAQLWGTLSTQALVTIDSLRFGQIALSGALRFQRVTPSALEETMVGFKFDNNGLEIPLILLYDNPDTVFRFPLNFLDESKTTFTWTLDLTPFNLDVIYKANQTREYQVDGWGYLHTPFRDSLSALRIKSVVTNADTVILNGIPTPLANTATVFLWLDTMFNMPVLEVIRSVGAITNLLSVRFLDTPRCILPTAAFTVNPPDPPPGMTTIQFGNASINAGQFFWDFGDGTSSQSSNPAHTYLSTGEYLITLVACNPVCDPLACDTTMSIVMISDTATAVPEPSNPADQYVIYPNPARTALAISSPHQQGHPFTIIDASGTIVQRGTTHNWISTENLSAGQFWVIIDTGEARVVLPFMKTE